MAVPTVSMCTFHPSCKLAGEAVVELLNHLFFVGDATPHAIKLNPIVNLKYATGKGV